MQVTRASTRPGRGHVRPTIYTLALVIVLTASLGGSAAHASIVLLYFRGVLRTDNSIELYWETASEISTTGFVLYRSEAVNQVGQAIANLSAKGSPYAGAGYWYVDPWPPPGRIYYYRLEEIEFDGAASWYGPVVIRAGPCTFCVYLPLVQRSE